MTDNGYVKLYRKMTEWEWYKNETVKSVFLHCLLKANFAPQKFEGMTIKKGEFVTSYKKLAEELGFSVHRIRNAIEKLKSTNELASKTTNKFSVITVLKWEDFQADEKNGASKTASKTANNGHSIGTQTAFKGQQYKNIKNIKNEKNNIGARAPGGACPDGAFSYGRVFSPSMVETNETPEEEAERIRRLREG